MLIIQNHVEDIDSEKDHIPFNYVIDILTSFDMFQEKGMHWYVASSHK